MHIHGIASQLALISQRPGVHHHTISQAKGRASALMQCAIAQTKNRRRQEPHSAPIILTYNFGWEAAMAALRAFPRGGPHNYRLRPKKEDRKKVG